MAHTETQVAVIGAGPGGYAAAFMAADLGLEVTLIDPEENPGGVCLYRGCIPSKTLLHAAALIHETRSFADRGIVFKDPEIDLDRLREWKDGVVKKLTGGLGQLAQQRSIRYIRGKAAFLDDRTLEVTADGAVGRLSFEQAVIATGSSPIVLPIGGEGSERLMDSTGGLELTSIPEKLLVIGGGYIGLEIGTVYAALGAKVTVVEMTGGLLPGADRDLVRVLEKSVAGRFAEILFHTRVTQIREQKNGLKVVLQGPDGAETARIFDKALSAVGRRPQTGGLGLENTGVTVNARGFIEVDEQQRTSAPSIYAIGDVAGEPMLAHKASHEGRVAAEAMAGRKTAFEPAAIPAVVFTDPEIAWAGLTEAEAKDRNIPHMVTRFPWAASGRAAALGRGDGLTKLVMDPETERILGVGIAGIGAGELIAEGVLAIEMGANATDLELTIHPHPTLSETVMEAAGMLHGTATHFHRPAKKSKGK